MPNEEQYPVWLVWALHGATSRVELIAICTTEEIAMRYRDGVGKRTEFIRQYVEKVLVNHLYGQSMRLSGVGLRA